MTEDEAYKVHIQYTFNAFCKVVIRHAAIDEILKLRRRWEREVSLDYLMNEKFVQLPERERIIVDLRFGLSSEDGEEKTQKEVADMLGISQSYISRLEKKIMRQLRKEMVKSC